MRPSDVLGVKSEQGVAVIFPNGLGAHTIEILGKSMPASVDTGVGAEFISLELDNDSRGIIALRVYAEKSNPRETHHILNVRKIENEQKIEVNLEHQFAYPKRLGSIDRNGVIQVRVSELVIGGVVFVSAFPIDKGTNEATPECRLVHPDILCRYLAGLIDVKDLDQASTEHVAALSALQKLEMRATRLGEIISSLHKRCRETEKEIEKKTKEAEIMLLDFSKIIKEVPSCEYFVSRKLRRIIEELKKKYATK